ncbi:hypothetical protein AVEN_90439-1 [Araneus ventricosus]|uniref:Uncharacterized protein n=1 Tax=Araneus ventricosus TaxID=182803 RepID=A0A4Y2SS37_ARAVE|nr:hypothetical protein AVEN_89372-1 [Araneus ventricosus]GBN90019.1 hypothetical protein AVEN_90439-1 [Araneus ventricosus]
MYNGQKIHKNQQTERLREGLLALIFISTVNGNILPKAACGTKKRSAPLRDQPPSAATGSYTRVDVSLSQSPDLVGRKMISFLGGALKLIPTEDYTNR